jgi:hypothetical protein
VVWLLVEKDRGHHQRNNDVKSNKVNNDTAEMIALAADIEEGQFCQKLPQILVFGD